MLSRLVNKAKVQLEDVVWKGNARSTFYIALTILNRRGLPVPKALFWSLAPTDLECTDMGNEAFLTDYMIPPLGKCYVDIGAATGGWSMFIAQRGFAVYSFEPSPKAYELLVLRMKRFSNVHLYPYAMGDSDTTGRLGVSLANCSGTMDAEEKHLHGVDTIDVPVRRLDSIDLPVVGVIKIDTEGYETAILSGASGIIRRDKPRLVIEVHQASGKAAETYEEELDRIKAIVKGFGYSWMVKCRQVSLHEMQPFVIAEPA